MSASDKRSVATFSPPVQAELQARAAEERLARESAEAAAAAQRDAADRARVATSLARAEAAAAGARAAAQFASGASGASEAAGGVLLVGALGFAVALGAVGVGLVAVGRRLSHAPGSRTGGLSTRYWRNDLVHAEVAATLAQEEVQAVAEAARVYAEALHQSRNEALAAIRGLAARLHVGSAERYRFDGPEAGAIDAAVGTLLATISTSANPAGEVAALAMRADSHLKTVGTARAAHEELRAVVRAEVDDCLLRADTFAGTTIAHWAASEVTAAREGLVAASHRAEDDPHDARAIAHAAKLRLDAAVGLAERREGADMRMRYLLDAVSRSMGARGWASYAPERIDPQDPDSGLVLELLRPGDRRDPMLHVTVDVQGRVQYGAEGLPMHRRSTQNFGLIATCPETEELLTELHEDLASVGIEMDELDWDGRPPGGPEGPDLSDSVSAANENEGE